MNIFMFKMQLEQIVQPPPLHSLISAEQAWMNFKAPIKECLDEAYCEEFGFSMSMASHFDGAHILTDENLFQVYFSRLIDAKKGYSWQFADINFYYRYKMNAKLRFLLAKLRQQNIETAFCRSEDEKVIRQKFDTVFTFADEQKLI